MSVPATTVTGELDLVRPRSAWRITSVRAEAVLELEALAGSGSVPVTVALLTRSSAVFAGPWRVVARVDAAVATMVTTASAPTARSVERVQVTTWPIAEQFGPEPAALNVVPVGRVSVMENPVLEEGP